MFSYLEVFSTTQFESLLCQPHYIEEETEWLQLKFQLQTQVSAE